MQRLFAQGLGERVGIGPSHTRGARTAGGDELILHPPLTTLFGLLGEGRGAGGAEFATRVGSEFGQSFGCAAGRFGVTAQTTRGRHFGAPRQADVEWSGVHEFFGCVAATVAGHVTGGNGYEVGETARGARTFFVEHLSDTHGAEQVDLDRAVERRVERDAGRRVDDDVARREGPTIVGGESESVGAHVTAHDADTRRDSCIELIAPFGAQSIERVVLHDLASHAFGGRGSFPVANEQHERAIGNRAEQSFDEGRTHETGCTGDADATAGQGGGDHDTVLAPLSTKW